MDFMCKTSQKAGDSLTLSRRGFHVEPGAREKAVSAFLFSFVNVLEESFGIEILSIISSMNI